MEANGVEGNDIVGVNDIVEVIDVITGTMLK